MENLEIPSIQYDFLEGNAEGADIHESGITEGDFMNILERRRNDEIKRGSNLVGPHRDDFLFKINAYSLKKYGSQGQNKTFQISLRFAQFFYLKDSLQRVPVFLMDDVFGELDAHRAKKLVNT